MAVYKNFLKNCFNEKTILFPNEYLKDLTVYSFPIQEIFIGIIVSCALFPQKDEEQQHMGYIAQHFYNIIKELEFSHNIDNSDENTKQFIHNVSSIPVMFFGRSYIFYESLLNWKKFSKTGKGSLSEKINQGLLCGRIFKLMYEENLSTIDAISSIIDTINKNMKLENSDNPFPMLTKNNISTNYWPKFKGIAWLWYALLHLFPNTNNDQQVNVIDTEFFTENGKSLLLGRDGWGEVILNSIVALAAMEKRHTIDDDTWVYMDYHNIDALDDYFPKVNVIELNNMFSNMLMKVSNKKYTITLHAE